MVEKPLQVEKNRSLYPKESQYLTEKMLADLDPSPLPFTGGKYRLKHGSSGEDNYEHGFITIQNALKSDWIVENDEGDLHLHYRTITDLINDGWVMD